MDKYRQQYINNMPVYLHFTHKHMYDDEPREKHTLMNGISFCVCSIITAVVAVYFIGKSKLNHYHTSLNLIRI